MDGRGTLSGGTAIIVFIFAVIGFVDVVFTLVKWIF